MSVDVGGKERTARRQAELFFARDFDAMEELFAPEVTLNSPITDSFHFRGREELIALLKEVAAVFEEEELVHTVAGDDQVANVYRNRVRGRQVTAVQLLEFDDEDRIREITMFFRPMPALAAFAVAIAPPLGRRRGRLLELTLTVLTWPLGPLTYFGDKLVARLLRGTWGDH